MPSSPRDAPFLPPDLDDPRRRAAAAPLPEALAARLRLARLVHGALAASVAIFGGVTGTIVALRGPVAPTLSLGHLAWLLPLGLLAVLVPAGAILRRSAIANARRNPSQADSIFSTATIVSAAIVEGPALLAAVLHLLTGDLRSLVVCGAGVVLLVLRWPTRAWAGRFVEG